MVSPDSVAILYIVLAPYVKAEMAKDLTNAPLIATHKNFIWSFFVSLISDFNSFS